jgi:hypothetical protein
MNKIEIVEFLEKKVHNLSLHQNTKMKTNNMEEINKKHKSKLRLVFYLKNSHIFCHLQTTMKAFFIKKCKIYRKIRGLTNLRN